VIYLQSVSPSAVSGRKAGEAAKAQSGDPVNNSCLRGSWKQGLTIFLLPVLALLGKSPFL
jgi:hypothetical protein